MLNKLFATLVILSLASSPISTHYAEYAQIVEEVNNSNSTWTASTEFIESLTEEELNSLVGTILETPDVEALSYENIRQYVNLPSSFSCVEQWPHCNWEILNQGGCGSCWAFGAAESLSGRYCVATGKSVVLSPQELVSCDNTNGGCKGGLPYKAWQFMQEEGLPTLDCLPYTSGTTHQNGTCPKDNGCLSERYFASSVYKLPTKDDIKQDLIKNGPCEASFTVYQDFFSYKSGVYVHKTGKAVGGHAIKIVGYGTEDGVDYWLAANSWGPKWGINGYFKIGQDQCGISNYVVAGNVKK